MLPILSIALVFLSTVACATALPYDALISSLVAPRQMSTKDCTATCAAFEVISHQCTVPQCQCTANYLQAQGDCLVCQTRSPEDAADVQFLVNMETIKCQSDGIDIPVQLVQLQLPPPAAAILQNSDPLNEQLRSEQSAFLAMQLAGGHIGLVILLVISVFSGFSGKIHRDPTFFNFCITWIFSSIVFSILLYRGNEGNTIGDSLGEVSPNMCLAQVTLTCGAQVMTACSTMALVVQLWLSLRGAVYKDVALGPIQTKWTKIALLGTPYILFLVFALASNFVGGQPVNIDGMYMVTRVLPTRFYCMVMDLDPLIQAVYGLTLALLVITLAFDALIIHILYKHWSVFRRIQSRRDVSPVSLSILLRVIAFSVYRVVVAVAYGTVLHDPPKMFGGFGDVRVYQASSGVPTWVDMLQAALPLVGFLVLGINKELIIASMFWRKRRPAAVEMVINSRYIPNTSIGSAPWAEKFSTEDDV